MNAIFLRSPASSCDSRLGWVSYDYAKNSDFDELRHEKLTHRGRKLNLIRHTRAFRGSSKIIKITKKNLNRSSVEWWWRQMTKRACRCVCFCAWVTSASLDDNKRENQKLIYDANRRFRLKSTHNFSVFIRKRSTHMCQNSSRPLITVALTLGSADTMPKKTHSTFFAGSVCSTITHGNARDLTVSLPLSHALLMCEYE